MHIKIEIEDAPREVNAVLADAGEDGRYGTYGITKEMLVATLKARANQIYADLHEMQDAITKDVREIAEEMVVIAAYVETLAPPFGDIVKQGRHMLIGDGGKRCAVFTPEERERAENWVTHEIEDAVGLNFVKDILDGVDRWSPLLHALRGNRDLTDRQVEALRGVADKWRVVYAKELANLDADHVDRPGAEKELALAESMISTLDRAERVSVDA